MQPWNKSTRFMSNINIGIKTNHRLPKIMKTMQTLTIVAPDDSFVLFWTHQWRTTVIYIYIKKKK